VALVAGALLSLARMLTTATTIVLTARHLTSGSILAAQKVEELRTVVAGLPAGGDTRGGVEFIDRVGVAFSADADAAIHVSYTRQWWIRPLPSDPNRVSVIHVIVTPGTDRDDRSGPGPRRPDAVVLMTLQAGDGP
jgi:hypothetical protein